MGLNIKFMSHNLWGRLHVVSCSRNVLYWSGKHFPNAVLRVCAKSADLCKNHNFARQPPGLSTRSFSRSGARWPDLIGAEKVDQLLRVPHGYAEPLRQSGFLFADRGPPR